MIEAQERSRQQFRSRPDGQAYPVNAPVAQSPEVVEKPRRVGHCSVCGVSSDQKPLWVDQETGKLYCKSCGQRTFGEEQEEPEETEPSGLDKMLGDLELDGE